MLSMVPLMIGISALVFLLMYLSPGDFLSEARNSKDISPEIVKQEEIRLGLDKPWYVQYGRWLNSVSPIKTNLLLPENERGKHSLVYFGSPDFGYSWSYKIPVTELVGQRIFPTLLLALASTFLIYAVSIPLGVLAAVKRDGFFDKLSAFLAYAALSIPYFFLALLAVLFAAVTGLFPTGGQVSILHDFLSPAGKVWDWIEHLILPTLVLSVGGIASMMRVMRGNFLDYSRAEFVTTARAKGMGENAIMFKHVLRNALNPVITSFGFAFAGLLSGALLVENVMNYPGLGQLIYAAIIKQDQYVVMAGVVIGCAMLVVGQLLADILLALADPRIRLEREKAPTKAIAIFTAFAALAAAALTWASETYPAFLEFLKSASFAVLIAAAAVLCVLLVAGLGWAAVFFCKNLLPQTLRSPRGATALAVLAVLYAAAILAPFLAPSGTFVDLDGTPTVIDNGWLGHGPAGVAYLIGDVVCHQEISRSFVLNGSQMPICIRDTGILIGLLLGFSACAAVRPRAMSLRWALLGAALVCVTVVEWLCEGMVGDMPGLRIASGVCAGIGISVLLCWYLCRDIADDADGRTLG